MKRIVALVLVLAMAMSFMTFTTVNAANTNLENMIRVSNLNSSRANVKMSAGIDLGGGALGLMGVPSGRLATLDYDINVVANEEKTKCDAAANFTISAPEFLPAPIGLDMWMKEDITNINNPQFYIILKLAEALRTEAGLDKEYVYIDYTQIPGFKEILNFVMSIDEAEIEKLVGMLRDALSEYIDEETLAELEQKIISIMNQINVEYANGKYTLVMGDKDVKDLYVALFDALFDVAVDVAYRTGMDTSEVDEAKAELAQMFKPLYNVQIFDPSRAIVIEVTEDGKYMHTEVNIATNLYDVVVAVDPASAQGVPASMRDMMDLSLSVKADATVTPLGSDYQIAFPQLSDENTFDVMAEMMPVTAEKAFDTAMVEIEYNGDRIQLENVPILLDDRTFVPLRELANAFGISDADIAYDEATEKVTIKSGDVEIVMYIGSTMTFVNNELKTLDVPAFTHNDRTYIPVRFVSEMFHKNVDYVDLNATGQGNGIVVMIND